MVQLPCEMGNLTQNLEGREATEKGSTPTAGTVNMEVPVGESLMCPTTPKAQVEGVQGTRGERWGMVQKAMGVCSNLGLWLLGTFCFTFRIEWDARGDFEQSRDMEWCKTRRVLSFTSCARCRVEIKTAKQTGR